MRRVDVPVETADVRPENNFHAGLQRAPEGALVDLAHLFPYRRARLGPPFGHVLADEDRGYVEYALLHHHADIFVGDIVAVFDRVDSRFDRIVHALQRHRVRRDLVALTMCLVHYRPQLVERESRDIVERPVRLDLVAAVGIDLDPIGSMIDLLAHRAARVIGAVYFLHSLRYDRRRRVA